MANPLLADYATKHADKKNVAIHVATVPIATASVLFGVALIDPRAALALAGAVLLIQLTLDARHALLFAPMLAALAVGAWAAAPLVGWKLGLPLALAGLFGAVGAQGAGHRRETIVTHFTGPHHFLFVILREQLVLSPLYLASVAG